MTPSTQDKITRLIKSATNVRNAKNAAQREAARGFMIQRARELCEQRDRLIEKMDAGWDWLAQTDAEYPVSTIHEEQVNRANRIRQENPKYAANEEKLIAWQEDYAAICDALDQAADIWTCQDGQVAA
jgi:hypothetical protein